MEANSLPALEDWELCKPLPRWFGKELPWWLALMVLGDSAPIQERALQETKRDWDEDDADGAVEDIRRRFNELQASTLDNFVRLTIIGAVVAGLMSLGQVVAPYITNNKTPLACQVASWVYVAFTLVAIVCVLMMVIPKYKEWRKFTPASRDNVGLDVLISRRNKGWPEFVRLQHRYAHRIQLITFERRVKHVGCVAAVLAYAAFAIALLSA